MLVTKFEGLRPPQDKTRPIGCHVRIDEVDQSDEKLCSKLKLKLVVVALLVVTDHIIFSCDQ